MSYLCGHLSLLVCLSLREQKQKKVLQTRKLESAKHQKEKRKVEISSSS